MKKEVLKLIDSNMPYINSGQTIDVCYQRSSEVCQDVNDWLDRVRPKSDDERDAIAYAKQQLQLNDLMGAYNTLEPFCEDSPDYLLLGIRVFIYCVQIAYYIVFLIRHDLTPFIFISASASILVYLVSLSLPMFVREEKVWLWRGLMMSLIVFAFIIVLYPVYLVLTR